MDDLLELCLEALEKLRMSKRDLCWCDMAIGNPMVHGHTEACKVAYKAYQRLNA